MKIKRKSPISGKENIREIDVDLFQLARWHKGELIQNVMPHLSPGDREFLMTGITEDEWEAMFAPTAKLELQRQDAFNKNIGEESDHKDADNDNLNYSDNFGAPV